MPASRSHHWVKEGLEGDDAIFHQQCGFPGDSNRDHDRRTARFALLEAPADVLRQASPSGAGVAKKRVRVGHATTHGMVILPPEPGPDFPQATLEISTDLYGST
jgi:hypothetical protein